jgi:hypothetical protein
MLLPIHLFPAPSPPSWAPGWTSTQRISVNLRTFPASSSWWLMCSSTRLAQTWSAGPTFSWPSWRTWSSAKLSRRVRSWDGKKEHMRRGGCWVPEGRGSKPDARPGARTNLGPHRQGTTSGKESCCGSGAGSFQAGRGLLCRGRAQGKAVTRDLLPPAALSPAPVPALNQLQS